MTYDELETAINGNLRIKHKNNHDSLFRPSKVLEKTEEDVQLKGAWYNSIYDFKIDDDYLVIKLKDLNNWKVITG